MHLYDFLFERGHIPENQWGFTLGKSTVTALFTKVHSTLQLLESGNDVSFVFFDLRKVFDTVPHLPLLNKKERTEC